MLQTGWDITMSKIWESRIKGGVDSWISLCSARCDVGINN